MYMGNNHIKKAVLIVLPRFSDERYYMTYQLDCNLALAYGLSQDNTLMTNFLVPEFGLLSLFL